MNINKISYSPNFGRALSTKESIAYSRLIKDVSDKLELKDTSAIIFDFNVPSKKGENTAIGSTWSEAMPAFIKFIKQISGINSVQLEPQGKISNANRSAYSGTTFAYGEHIIDLSKLTEKSFGQLLTKKYVKNLDKQYPASKEQREYRTDYPYVFSIQEKALKLAYENFNTGLKEKRTNVIKLNNEFKRFKTENADWLEKETTFNALTKLYKTNDFNKWSDKDKNLYGNDTPENIRKERIEEIRNLYPEDIEFETFVQFIADKQQKGSHALLNSKDISLYGDCLIGFSQSEMWANKDCFRENLYYGGPDPNCPETNYIQTWDLPALNYNKLGECSEDGDISKLDCAGKLLYEKFSTFFKRYDGVRVDAAWQFVTPFIYQAINGTYEEVKFPEISSIIFNIIKAAANNSKKDNINDRIMLELVGLSAGRSRKITLNKYPHLYTTAYAEYDECPAQFIKKGYKDGKFYTGVGNHDNDSLNNMARDVQKRELHLKGIKRDYPLDETIIGYKNKKYKEQSDEEKKQENFRTLKLAEIFTSSKQFFTLPDLFGMSERINVSGKSDPNNWTIRIPSDYKKFYFTQLSNGYGINFPKIFANALKMKNSSSKNLIKKCDEAAEILREDGPLTREEADTWEKAGKIKNKFEYN